MPSTGHTSTQGTPPSASLHDRGLVPIQDSVITYAIRCHLALALAGLCSQTALAPLARPEAKDPSWEGLLAPPVARTGSHLSSIPAVGSLRCGVPRMATSRAGFGGAGARALAAPGLPLS